MPQGLVKPSNAILYAGTPESMNEMEVKTATSCYPGRLVIHDTNEWDVKVATSGAANVIGVLDVEATERRSTQYGAGDQARILRGDIVVLLTADSGSAISVGTRLQAANSGMVKVAAQNALSGGGIVAYALQAVSANTKATLLAKLLI